VLYTYVSDSEAHVVTPTRSSPGTAHVSASNDGSEFSAFPLVYTKGSGTFLKFIFDNSEAGCLDCLNSADGVGLNPLQITEMWHLDNATGPYVGGTEVTITARGLDWAAAGVAPTDLTMPGTGQLYNGPVGGPGTPHPHNVDPMSSGNGPPVTGTFYPHKMLACKWICYLDMDQDPTTGTDYAYADGVEHVVSSEWIDARWKDYTEITCESPAMTVPTASAGGPADIAPTRCNIHVSNDRSGTHATAFAPWRYEDKRPTVTNIKTNQFSVWPARGPFMGNTEVTITGTDFLPSKYLKCKFGGVNSAAGAASYVEDDVSHVVGEPGGRARYVSSTEIVCVTPVFGPAAAAAQYPPGTLEGSVGAGAILEIDAYGPGAASATAGEEITSVEIISGGRGYQTPPLITIEGGGGCCARLTATVDAHGAIDTVTIAEGGAGYNMGVNATATAVITNRGYLDNVAKIVVDAGGTGYRVPPDVVFSCASGGDSCFQKGDASSGSKTPAWSPGRHATARAIMAPDVDCPSPFFTCAGKTAVASIEVTFAGAYYTEAPVVTIVPAKPFVRVTPMEINPTLLFRDDPSQVGYYSKQGKSVDELDPEVAHGSWPDGAEDTTIHYPVTFPGSTPTGVDSAYGIPGIRNGRLPGVSDKKCAKTLADCPHGVYGWKSCMRCPELRNPEDRGPLLPPLGRAYMDGSVKPGHQELVRVSNNYHKFGAFVGEETTRTHFGYRNESLAVAGDAAAQGYWLWSESGMTADEMNRCRVSTNPPVHPMYGFLEGHGLDAALGLGTADDEFTLGGGGGSNNLLYLDGSSVGGAPGSGATAIAQLSDTDANCAASGKCYVAAIVVTNPGKGYMYPPAVRIAVDTSGGAAEVGYGAVGVAVISGGTVLRVEVDPLSRGIGYVKPPIVTLAAVREATTYDAGTGQGSYAIDQSANSVWTGQYRQTSNLDVGHGAFPGHPGNTNLGHPRKDCIYFFYSDVYASPSGSDSTGQGTAGRPYRTVQKCIDASLAGARDYYVYKRADGGDRDPAIPDGTARYGTESAGERVDATAPGGNTPTGRDKGYTGRQVRNYNARKTGLGKSGKDRERDSAKGFGYTVNRDRCILKDGVYWGEGNRDLQPHGHVVEVWAENANNVTIDCGGRSIGKHVFTADKHGGERATVVGSVNVQGVVMRRCNIRADPKPNYRPYYPGRPGYGPGTRNPNGQMCWPGATGCQARQGVDGMAAGQ
jgi:hypothetical protein